ncbi:MAG TPA: hypothetical protein VHC90_15470 [Bryobacteraceae bacterium]|nr:hypothetical protein [Bryobacteraceae bacterium]
MKRRTFLQTAGAAAGFGIEFSPRVSAQTPPTPVTIVLDLKDPVASSPPAKWAVTELFNRLEAHGVLVRLVGSVAESGPGEICLIVSGPSFTAPAVLPAAARPPAAAESFAIANAAVGGKRALIAAGRDPRGIVYALLELADRVDYEESPAAALRLASRIVEQPANRIRSVLKPFVSEVEDKPWFYDRGAWRDYLTMLATHRFNRLNLSFGIGYDFVNEIRDSYFHFTYPFFLNVPGYNVQIVAAQPFGEKPKLLTDTERDRNLTLLQFISAAAAERGLDFQLGLWTHAWNFDAAPNATHRIRGLTKATHAPYCRDALHALLAACPAITGVTLRTHGESGVPEQSYAFWKTVFSGITAAGRKIEIDQHAKGIDAEMIAMAEATGMPTTVSPKYWAEHMGLPYHQASIRPNEMPKSGAPEAKGALMSLSNGSRNFMRYGYGDLLREGRRYSVLHRIWPGTQRLLLSGDPLMAAGYGRASSFAGSEGVEWMEPLSFKGRKGSGLAGGRDSYAGVTQLNTRDWQKYEYTYRVWGRGIYNPASNADSRRRYVRSVLGEAGEAAESALNLSTRILPTVTTAHLPSAANANYWPEIYTNQSIPIADAKDLYSDTPSPKRFGTVSPLDPQLFSTIDECAENLLNGTNDPRYSPIEVAAWLEDLAQTSDANLAAAPAVGTSSKVFQHWSVDIGIQNNLGRFFAAKFRSGVLYGIYTRTSDPAALEEALNAYKKARDAWKAIATLANKVYRPDLTFGYAPNLRGSWQDRLGTIDDDIAAMEKGEPAGSPTKATSAIVTALSTPHREIIELGHTPVKRARAGAGIPIAAALPEGAKGKLNLCYRHVNQAEKWVSVAMEPAGAEFRAEIPAAYTSSPYALLYYFEIHLDHGAAGLYPGLPRDYSTQPYFLIRRG